MQNSAGYVSSHPQIARADRLFEDKNYEQAAQLLIGFLRQHPDHPQAIARLGFVANRLGALGQAEHFLRKAITLGSADFETRRQLAAVLSQQDRPALAMPMFEALTRENQDPGLRAILAGMMEKIGQSEEARPIFRQLAEENPENPQMWVGYGHSLRANGQVDDAIAAYRRALATDDGFGEAWWGLASIKRKIFGQADIAAMRAALKAAIDIRNEAPLNFALARALHDQGEYAEAFHHYSEGNRLRAETLEYNADELTEEIDEVERTIGKDFVARLPDTPVGEGQPVFIVSLPRSGSTLLEQMLGSHSQIEPAGELPYIPAILRGFMEMATRRGKVTVPRAIAELTDEQAAMFGREYLERTALHRQHNSPTFIDKLPHNWNNILFIRRILPQARFIEIRRPAMDCCFSNFTQSFTSAHPSSFALRDVGRSYVDSIRMMDHLDRIAPGLVLHIDYSLLVEQPEREIGRALDYLQLAWEDSVLQFHQLDRVVRTPSSEQVRRPLNRDGMAIWKPYSEWLDPLREVLGRFAEQ